MAGVHHPDAPVRTPLPEFSIISVAPLAYAAVPTMVFTINAVEPKGHDVFAIALSTQIHIDPARRTYDPETRSRLGELLRGEPRCADDADLRQRDVPIVVHDERIADRRAGELAAQRVTRLERRRCVGDRVVAGVHQAGRFAEGGGQSSEAAGWRRS